MLKSETQPKRDVGINLNTFTCMTEKNRNIMLTFKCTLGNVIFYHNQQIITGQVWNANNESIFVALHAQTSFVEQIK